MKDLFQCLLVFTVATTTLSAQWMQTNGPAGGLIYDLEQISDKVWAGTATGLYTLTENSTWQQSDLIPESFTVADFYTSANEILMLCIKLDRSQVKILRSVDQGSNWTTYTVSNPLIQLSYDPASNKVHIVKSGNRVYLYSNTKAYYLDNFTEPWAGIALPGNAAISNIAIDSNSIVARSGSGGVKLFRSANGGSNWTSTVFFQGAALFLEDSLIITKNNTNKIAISADWGNTWTYKPTRSIDISLIKRGKDGKLYSVMNDSVFYSTDNGLTWNGKSVGTPHYIYQNLTAVTAHDDIVRVGTHEGVRTAETWNSDFIFENEGLINSSVRHILSNQKNKLYATTLKKIFYSNDKGNSWSEMNIPFDSFPPYFALVSRGDTVFLNAGYLINNTPVMARSYDNGATWDQLTLPGNLPTTLFVHFVYSEPLIWQDNVLIVRFFDEVLNQHTFAISTDMGSTWKTFNYANAVASINVRDMVYLNNKIYSIEIDGSVRVSADKGTTWIKIFNLKDLDPTIAGVDRLYKAGDTYYITSSSNNILYTDDQFATVNLIKANGLPLESGNIIAPVAFMAHIGDTLFGITKNRREISFSTDKGQNWAPYHNNLDDSWAHPTDVCVFDGQLYIGTQNNGVWRYGDIVSATNNNNPAQFSAQTLQINPNPVTDQISVQLPAEWVGGQEARLNLYGIDGQLLFYQHMTTSAQLNLTLPDLESGVYILEVATEKGRSTGRLVKQ